MSQIGMYQLTYKYLVWNGIRMLLLDVGNAILRYGIRYVLINLEETQMYLVVYNIPYRAKITKTTIASHHKLYDDYY
jgi:hypothetical protein